MSLSQSSCACCGTADGYLTRVRPLKEVHGRAISICDRCEERQRNPSCDFCGKTRDEVNTLMAGRLGSVLQDLPDMTEAIRTDPGTDEGLAARFRLDDPEIARMTRDVVNVVREHLDMFGLARAYICNECITFFCKCLGEDDAT